MFAIAGGIIIALILYHLVVGVISVFIHIVAVRYQDSIAHKFPPLEIKPESALIAKAKQMEAEKRSRI